MGLNLRSCVVSISLFCYLLCCAITPPPILSTHFSARIRPSKFFDQSFFAHGRSSLMFINVTNYQSEDDFMLSELASEPSNESNILYQSYINGREGKAYFIYDGQCETHVIDGIPVVFRIVPSYLSFFFIVNFNLLPRRLTTTLQHCTYHESLDCEGWTVSSRGDKMDNITFFIHGSTILHYIAGYYPNKPVVFDQFNIGPQTIDKFVPPKAANCT